MLTKRIIPCLDVRDGRVVKGVRFSGLRDAGDPVEQAVRYERDGADELVMLDVSATPDARSTACDTVRALRDAISIPLCVGGGVRATTDAVNLLGAGADKVGINTAAVDRPDILRELAEEVGRQCVIIAIDAAQCGSSTGWEVVTRSGTHRTGIDAIDWARDAEQRGAGEILLTSWDRDGTHTGYDTELLRTVTHAVRIPVIASGGASNSAHMLDAFDAGADAVLAASIFHDQKTTVTDIKRELASGGIEVRR
ncbi:MAG: imidazole glycerol phosphate synthase subunit HisF [Planctomycetota bacterium]